MPISKTNAKVNKSHKDSGEIPQSMNTSGPKEKCTMRDIFDSFSTFLIAKVVSIEDFALLKELGKGEFGRVILVKKRDTGELFALKSIKKSEIIAKGQWEHTRTERMVLEKIRHPFLVRLEFCFESQEKVYFVMQYMK